MIIPVQDGSLLISGRSREILSQALVDAQRWRRRNGYPSSLAYDKLAQLMSPNGHADIETEPLGQPVSMTIEQAAQTLHKSPRQVRRMASQLGGRKVGRSWLLSRADVLAHREGA